MTNENIRCKLEVILKEDNEIDSFNMVSSYIKEAHRCKTKENDSSKIIDTSRRE